MEEFLNLGIIQCILKLFLVCSSPPQVDWAAEIVKNFVWK